jgi:hypothetical protein
MAYSQTQVMTTQSTLTTFGSELSLRLNSIYDPDFSVGGHQPYGYDQFVSFYSRYLVLNADIELLISGPSQDGIVLGMQLKQPFSGQTVANSSIDEVTERQASLTKWVNDTGSQISTIKTRVPMWSFFGYQNEKEYIAAAYSVGAVYNADPSTNFNAYLSFAVANSRGGASATAVVSVRITYDVYLFARTTLPSS